MRVEIAASFITTGVLLLLSDKRKQFVNLHEIRFHVADFGVQQAGAFLPCRFKDAQDRAPVKPGKAFTGTDAHSLAEQVNHLAGLLEVHAQPVQRLFFGERFAATQTAIALHCEVFVFESAKLLGLTVTAMTRHLTLSRPRHIVCVYPQRYATDRSMAFGCDAVGGRTPAASLLMGVYLSEILFASLCMKSLTRSNTPNASDAL